MSKYIEKQENEIVEGLSSEQIKILSNLKQNDRNLPFQIKGTKVIFDSYTIGSIIIDDVVLNIVPRNEKMHLNHYFEMYLYNEGAINREVESVVHARKNFNVQDELIKSFINEVKNLLSKGLEGDFNYIYEKGEVVKGRILIEKMTALDLKLNTVPVEFPYFSFNILPNIIIKHALEKVQHLIDEDDYTIFSMVYSHFDEVNLNGRDIESDKVSIRFSEYNENPKYKKVLKLSMNILEALKISQEGNVVKSSAFLINSNTVFENYALKVLKEGLEQRVEKWGSAKQFSITTSYNGKMLEKSYIPDVLINYESSSNISHVVLDAKNKDISNDDKLANISDLYQLFFYSRKLHSEFCGFIYPSSCRIEPTRIDFIDFPDVNMYYFTIDFSKPISVRNEQFVEDVKQITKSK